MPPMRPEVQCPLLKLNAFGACARVSYRVDLFKQELIFFYDKGYICMLFGYTSQPYTAVL